MRRHFAAATLSPQERNAHPSDHPSDHSFDHPSLEPPNSDSLNSLPNSDELAILGKVGSKSGDESRDESGDEKEVITGAIAPFLPQPGMRVSIYWKGIDKWEPGVVVRASNSQPGFWYLKYDDGIRECRPFKPLKWTQIN